MAPAIWFARAALYQQNATVRLGQSDGVKGYCRRRGVNDERGVEVIATDTYPRVVFRQMLASKVDIFLSLLCNLVKARKLAWKKHGITAGKFVHPEHIISLKVLLIYVNIRLVCVEPAQIMQTEPNALLTRQPRPLHGVRHPAVEQEHAGPVAANVIGRVYDPSEPQICGALAAEHWRGRRSLPESAAEVQTHLVERLKVRAAYGLLFHERPRGPVYDAVQRRGRCREHHSVKGAGGRTIGVGATGGKFHETVFQVCDSMHTGAQVDVVMPKDGGGALRDARHTAVNSRPLSDANVSPGDHGGVSERLAGHRMERVSGLSLTSVVSKSRFCKIISVKDRSYWLV